MTRLGPLKGIKVLDLTTNISGPVATLVLSGLGATVWKVERPDGGDDSRQMSPSVGGDSAYFVAINGGKKSIVLDLKKRRASEVLKRLVEKADVLVENYRPGVAEKLGLGWKAVHRLNPKLTYASISGYGDAGPERSRAGYDALLQARTGLISVTGRPGEPPVRVGVSVLDVGSGVWAALGVVASLSDRRKRRRGVRISTSLLETGIFLFAYHLLAYQLTEELPIPFGAEHPAFSPYGAFQAKGGETLFLGVSNNRQFLRLSRCIGRPELAEDPKFSTNPQRVKNRDELRSEVTLALMTKRAVEWERALTKAGVPTSRLQNARQVLRDPQARALELLPVVQGASGKRLRVPRLPVRLQGYGTKHAAPPGLGEHTREILKSVGFTESKIRDLQAEGIVLQGPQLK